METTHITKMSLATCMWLTTLLTLCEGKTFIFFSYSTKNTLSMIYTAYIWHSAWLMSDLTYNCQLLIGQSIYFCNFLMMWKLQYVYPIIRFGSPKNMELVCVVGSLCYWRGDNSRRSIEGHCASVFSLLIIKGYQICLKLQQSELSRNCEQISHLIILDYKVPGCNLYFFFIASQIQLRF